jgi:hypothetical protein
MRSKGNAPTAAQKRWREAVRELGSVISGDPAVIHHPIGTTGKHNKIDIGHEWIIPLTDEEHKALHRGEDIWSTMALYSQCKTRKEFEKAAFDVILNASIMFDCETPDWPERNAIADYHR